MYYSDHEVYSMATQCNEELRKLADAERLAASVRGKKEHASAAWKFQAGAILINIGRRLQEG